MMSQFVNYISVKKLFPTDGANCRWDFFLIIRKKLINTQ
jgi:hypothetical protein